jgi:hypothetical protein
MLVVQFASLLSVVESLYNLGLSKTLPSCNNASCSILLRAREQIMYVKIGTLAYSTCIYGKFLLLIVSNTVMVVVIW